MQKDTMQKLMQAAQAEPAPRANDLLDDLLDGKGVMIVDSPQLRRALRRRRVERIIEEHEDVETVRRESVMRREYGLFYGGS